MDIAALGSSPHLDAIMKEIDEHGLKEHALDLAAYGFTVVPPEKLGVDEQWTGRLRDAIMRVCEQRNGIKLGDWRTAETTEKIGGNSWSLMKEDDVFAEAAMNPAGLALIQFLLGRSAMLAGLTSIVKAQTKDYFHLHSDQHGIALGMGQVAQLCNASWLTTDYIDADDGPTILVPGSFRNGRAVLPHENNPENTPYHWVHLTGKAGSLAIWHGGVWHGSSPRKRSGLRVTLVQVWMRRHMQKINTWDDVPPDMLERHPGLEHLLGLDQTYPMGQHNPKTRAEKDVHMLPGTDPFA